MLSGGNTGGCGERGVWMGGDDSNTGIYLLLLFLIFIIYKTVVVV